MPPRLARHDRDGEDLSIAELASRLGRAQATVKAYLYDPISEKAREVKERYRGVYRGCGAATTARKQQWRRLPVLQGLPPRRDPNTVDAQTGARRDARLTRALRHRGTRAPR
jgi:hypothetical protein